MLIRLVVYLFSIADFVAFEILKGLIIFVEFGCRLTFIRFQENGRS